MDKRRRQPSRPAATRHAHLRRRSRRREARRGRYPLIESRIASGERYPSIARDFGVSISTISLIKQNKIWRSATGAAWGYQMVPADWTRQRSLARVRERPTEVNYRAHRESRKRRRSRSATTSRTSHGEAKGSAYDVKALRTIVRMRKQDANDRQEQETILEHISSPSRMINETFQCNDM